MFVLLQRRSRRSARESKLAAWNCRAQARSTANIFHHARFNFMSEAQIWCSPLLSDEPPPGKIENMIVLSHEFYKEIMDHPIPTDFDAAKALSSAPAALDLYTWLTYRCFSATGEECVPLFGEFELVNQLGIAAYARLALAVTAAR